MVEITNIRPGRSVLIHRIIQPLNYLRTILIIYAKDRYIKKGRGLRMPFNIQIWFPHKDISFGNRVQFGEGCLIYCDVGFGNNILIAKNVAFVGRDEHRYNVVGKTIWDEVLPLVKTKKLKI